MRLSDILILSWRQLKQRRLRSILTMLAVAVGVTTIIALSAQVEGVSATISQSLGKLGPDSIILTMRGRSPFTDADVASLQTFDGVSRVIPMLTTFVRVPGLNDPVNLVGISALDLANLLGESRLRDGQMYFDAPSPQALLGYKVAFDDTGQFRYSPGQPILARSGQRSIALAVVGVLDTYGAAPLLQPDNAIFVPIEYIKQILRGTGYTMVIVKAENIQNVEPISQLVTQVYSGRVNVMSIKQITDTVIQITGMITLLLVGIASTAFIAAGLGTLNIMMISVLERVREIGIFKALGMKDKEVLSIYIIQGLIVGFLGVLVGLGAGTALAYALPAALQSFGAGMTSTGGGVGGGMGGIGAFGGSGGFSMSFTPLISFYYVGIASATSLIVTLLSTAYPAWRASKLRPVEALKYE